MRIECEKCNAAYTIGDSLLSDQPIGAQCPYCGHVKVVTKADAAASAIAPRQSISTGEVSAEPPGGYGAPPSFDLDGPSLGGSNGGLGLDLGSSGPGSLPPFSGAGLDGPDLSGSLGGPPSSAGGLDFRTAPSIGESFLPGGGSVAPGDRFGAADSGLPAFGAEERSATGGNNCQVCGTVLDDEFDKVIGLCELHQRERGANPDAKKRAQADGGEWSARTASGDDVGPITLAELRSRLQRGEVPSDAQFSRDGGAYQPLDRFDELEGYGKRSAPPNHKPLSIEIPQQRTFIAKARRSRSSVGLGTVILLLLVIAVAGGVGYVILEPDKAKALYTEIVDSQQREAPRPPNPLRPLFDEWRKIHTDLGGTPEEHVLAAQQLHLEDTERGYAEAQVALQKALLLGEDNPVVMANFVENLVIWKAARLSATEIQIAQAAIKHANLLTDSEPAVFRGRAALELARGDLNGCRSWAERALSLDRADGQAKLLLSSSYLEGNGQLAIREAEGAVAAKPKLRRADRLLARAYADAGRYATAMTLLEKRVKDDPKNTAVHILYGQLSDELGRRDQAVKHYKAAAKGEGDNALAELMLGELLLSEGDSSAATALRQVMATDGVPLAYRARALTGLAQTEINRRQWRKAAEFANRAVEIAPRMAAALIARAEVALHTGSPTTATSFAQRALSARAGEPASLALLGRAAVAMRQPDQALARFEEAIQNDPRDPRLKGILAGMYLAFGGSSQAFAVMRQVADLDPTETGSPKRGRVLTLSRLAQEEAIERFASATGEIRNRSVAHSSIGVMQYHLGQRKAAWRSITEALTSDESNMTARLYESQMALEDGKLKRAEEAARTILDIDRSSAMGHLMLARTLLKKGKISDASDEYEAALRSQPGLMVATVESAGLALTRGDREEALEQLKQAHRLYPHLLTTRRLLYEAGY